MTVPSVSNSGLLRPSVGAALATDDQLPASGGPLGAGAGVTIRVFGARAMMAAHSAGCLAK